LQMILTTLAHSRFYNNVHTTQALLSQIGHERRSLFVRRVLQDGRDNNRSQEVALHTVGIWGGARLICAIGRARRYARRPATRRAPTLGPGRRRTVQLLLPAGTTTRGPAATYGPDGRRPL
jgi:hypothetical protein